MEQQKGPLDFQERWAWTFLKLTPVAILVGIVCGFLIDGLLGIVYGALIGGGGFYLGFGLIFPAIYQEFKNSKDTWKG